jgi:hypothetical protein
MYTKSKAVAGGRPPVFPAAAGNLLVADSSIEVLAAQIALNGLVGLMILPAGCVPVDFTLIEDDLDTGTALVQAVGVLNATEDDLVGSTNFLTGSTIGRAGGIARAAAFPDALVAPSASDRVIAIKTTTGGILPVKATATVTSNGTNVTANDTVTVNGKAYKFVEVPADEGDVDIGTNAAGTLANLKLAINRTDPTTNDGVKYKCAAAHTTVAATTITDTVLTLEALAEGAGGNAYTLAKSAVTLTVPAEEFDGGVTAVPLQGGTIRGILTYRSEEYGR